MWTLINIGKFIEDVEGANKYSLSQIARVVEFEWIEDANKYRLVERTRELEVLLG